MNAIEKLEADHAKDCKLIADKGIALMYLQRLTMYFYTGKLEQICKGVNKEDVFDKVNAFLLAQGCDIGLCIACEQLGDPSRLTTMQNGDRVCEKCNE